MINKKFAVIAEGDIEVANTIIAPADFRIEGAYLVELSNDNSAQPGAYYNPDDGRFYGDPAYEKDYRQFEMNI